MGCKDGGAGALARKSWSLIKEESTFIDWQRAKVQETPDEVRAPRQPCPPLHLHASLLFRLLEGTRSQRSAAR